ncbi:hypothetical protein RJI07_01795 [Mycoplasmatota bacterium WC30]
MDINTIENKIKLLVEELDKPTVIKWAYKCAKRALNEWGQNSKEFLELLEILNTINPYLKGLLNVSEVRKEALKAHNIAKKQTDLSKQYLTRSIGHAVASIHVKTHSLGMIHYIKKLNLIQDSEKAKQELLWQLTILRRMGKSIES